MTDLFRLVGPLRPTTSATEPAVRPTRDHTPGRSSEARTTPDALQAALDRLDQFLNSDTPPRADAPKGFYVNVMV